MTFSVEPEKYTAGYSFIPCGVSASIIGDEFEYLIDVIYNKTGITNINSVSFGGIMSAEITTAINHKFKRGERVYIEDSSDNKGYYIVKSVPAPNKMIIDLTIVSSLGSTPFVYSYYSYKMPPSPDGRAELDLSPVLSDFVTRNIIATSSVYAGPDTRFEWSLRLGQRSVYVFDFWDNIFVAGAIGFRNDTIPQSDTPPFKIGDKIFIEQEQTTVTYNYFVFPDPLDPSINSFLEVGSSVGDPLIFNTPGQTILLNSQTAPQYNGFTSVRDVLTTRLRLNIPQALTAVAGNSVDVTGFCRPEYNGVHTVTDVFFDSSLNEWIIKTDIPHEFNTPPVGGTIRFANGQKTTSLNLSGGEDYNTYNARWEKGEYNKTYDEYVIDGICPPVWILENGTWEDLGVWVDFGIWNDTPTGSEFSLFEWDKISTIYKSYFPSKQFFWRERKNWAPIQPDALCHLLVHNKTADATEGLWIETFDKSDNQLSLSFMKNNSGNQFDYYTPIGLMDILNSSDLIENIGTFSEAINNTAYYVVWAGPECDEDNNGGEENGCCPRINVYDNEGELIFTTETYFDGTNYIGVDTYPVVAPGTDLVLDIEFIITFDTIWEVKAVVGTNTFEIATDEELKEPTDCPLSLDWGSEQLLFDIFGADSYLQTEQGECGQPPVCCPIVDIYDSEGNIFYIQMQPDGGRYIGEIEFEGEVYELFMEHSGTQWGIYFVTPEGNQLVGTDPTGLGPEICPLSEDWRNGDFLFENYPGSSLRTIAGECPGPGPCCTTYTEKIPFLVDGCSRYTPWTIIFKDRRGTWAQYPFKMISREFIETERTNFYQQEGTFTDNDFFYDPFNDRGEKSFVTRSREKIRLSSDWVRDQQNYIIEDMFKSVELYIQNPETGEIKGIMIDNKEYENKKDINDMIHHYEFDINYTTDDWRL